MADDAKPPQSKYNPEYVDQARKLYQLGATDQEVADFFEVDRRTLTGWKARYPEFAESSRVGKEVADERVKSALYHRAVGYSHPETVFHVIDKKVVETHTIKHYPPDTAAGVWWTKNRLGWRDKAEIDAGAGLLDLIKQSMQPK